MGKFFDPDAGFWANAETATPESRQIHIEGLKEEVSIYYDERRVPHIFAKNEHDLFLAQGYVTAQQRLFQLEIQVYDAAGRLSELLGENPVVQRRDLTTRRWGMPWAAERIVEVALQDSANGAIVTAYTAGVNAYIGSLNAQDYPIEYKFFNAAPEPWSPLKTSLLQMNMTRTLAGGSSDDRASNTLAYLGADFVDLFFSTPPEKMEAIIPESRVWDFEAERPSPPEKLFVPKTAERIQFFDPDAGVGSNNWAVHGSKTASGHPILAGDPHLGLTMPSIWMEVQLNAPGYNAYGVTFQGIPGILIGFNEHIAWAETNTGADVMDWYEIQFKDESKDEYWHDNEWKPTSKRVEEIKVRGGETITETVVYTHHGPVTRANPGDTLNEPVYHAMRWIGHDAGNSLKTFIGLNKARNYDEYEEALRHYIAPAQNFVFASNEGDVAIWVNGQFPNKWDYQGRTVSDGTDPAYDWQGWIPQQHNPNVRNPERGFVSSANQESTHDSYPYYLADEFASYERGRRINDLLRSMENITPQDMMNMQMDNYSLHAESIVPELIDWTMIENLSDEEADFLEEMKAWNFEMDADLKQPGFFYYWWRSLNSAIFSDEFEAIEEPLRWPARDRVVEVIKSNPEYYLIDNIETDIRETINDLVTQSFKHSYKTMAANNGPLGESWNWGRVMNNDINHIGQIPGFGAMDIYSGGSFDAINATRFGYGPSWRMVVELGPEVKGWGVFPGGISGNPGSPNYDAFVENWRTGNHFELNFYREKPEKSLFELKLKPQN
jgi:penicillin amidase